MKLQSQLGKRWIRLPKPLCPSKVYTVSVPALLQPNSLPSLPYLSCHFLPGSPESTPIPAPARTINARALNSASAAILIPDAHPADIVLPLILDKYPLPGSTRSLPSLPVLPHHGIPIFPLWPMFQSQAIETHRIHSIHGAQFFPPHPPIPPLQPTPSHAQT